LWLETMGTQENTGAHYPECSRGAFRHRVTVCRRHRHRFVSLLYTP